MHLRFFPNSFTPPMEAGLTSCKRRFYIVPYEWPGNLIVVSQWPKVIPMMAYPTGDRYMVLNRPSTFAESLKTYFHRKAFTREGFTLCLVDPAMIVAVWLSIGLPMVFDYPHPTGDRYIATAFRHPDLAARTPISTFCIGIKP